MSYSPPAPRRRPIFRAALAPPIPARRGGAPLSRAAPYDRYRNIYVVGAGMPAPPWRAPRSACWDSRITAGLINVKDGHLAKLRRIELNECRHPCPTSAALARARRIAAIAAAAGAGRPVLCLISGGRSALLPFACRRHHAR
jgi:hydroxypyruvate reductase